MVALFFSLPVFIMEALIARLASRSWLANRNSRPHRRRLHMNTGRQFVIRCWEWRCCHRRLREKEAAASRAGNRAGRADSHPAAARDHGRIPAWPRLLRRPSKAVRARRAQAGSRPSTTGASPRRLRRSRRKLRPIPTPLHPATPRLPWRTHRRIRQRKRRRTPPSGRTSTARSCATKADDHAITRSHREDPEWFAAQLVA